MKKVLLFLFFAAGCASSEAVHERSGRTNQRVDIGYGTLESGRITSSVFAFRPTDLDRASSTTVVDMMVGRIPGVRVFRDGAGEIHVTIRGNRGLRSNNEPLIVIDDQIIFNSRFLLEGMPPGDVDSITVLKDAGATAAFGSRGANGVILLRTRRN